jgi:hypothetical protein
MRTPPHLTSTEVAWASVGPDVGPEVGPAALRPKFSFVVGNYRVVKDSVIPFALFTPGF